MSSRTLIFLFLHVWLVPSCAPADSGREVKNPRPPILGYVLDGTLRQERYLKGVLPRLDRLIITGHTLDARGRLRSRIRSRRLLALARLYGKPVQPLVNLRSVRDGKRLLKNSAARRRAVQSLLALARRSEFSGIHLDLEYLPPSYAPEYASLLRELRATLRKRAPGKQLTAAIFPPLEFPGKWSGFHDLRLLGPHLDEIVLMCYDYRGPYTGPGPVTSLGWTRRNLEAARKLFPAQRIWLGVPAYGYVWRGKRGGGYRVRAVSARRGTREAARLGGTRHSSGTIRYVLRGGRGVAYFADRRTRLEMERLARKFKLRGVAIWRLGFEKEL